VNDELTIRRVSPADASRIRAVRLEMLADAPLAFITTLAQAAEMPHEEWVGRAVRASAGYQNAQFVAEVHGRFVGSAGAFEHPTDSARTLLVAVYVSPSHRGSAALAAMVDAAAAWSREAGRPTLELEVVTTNARAVRAYEKLGFLPEGELIQHPTINSMREQMMTRPA
jgi:RimJ/RimL family protein N-acetyltransferase